MMKHKNFLLAAMTSMLCLTSCVPEENFIPTEKTKVTFWGWGNESEIAVFDELVRTFNATNKDNLYVVYNPQDSGSYISNMEKVLGSDRTPDIFYVGDGDLKRWVKYDYLENLDNYVKKSEVIDLDDIWGTALERYRYNAKTKTSNPTDPLYCLPKDIGPTVIYYNVDAFKKVGITIISKPESECTEEKERHGFYFNTVTGEKIFNNRISMTIEEELELAKLLTRDETHNPDSPTRYGFYTEWWFNYVWSVGGDCLGKDSKGNYIWTLGDTAPHGSLPSNRELFEHFINMSVVEKVMPNPSTVKSDRKVSNFYNETFAMLVDLRASVTTFRNMAKFEWDVAPLSHVKGGNLAGHSGSMGFGISKRISQERKDNAFKFMEYLAGSAGQIKTAESGFNLPNQISIANSDYFLQKDQYPHNSIVFAEAAKYQTKGDWAYLPDKLWIDGWAKDLNGPVLEGTMSIDEFFTKHQASTDAYLKEHY